MDTIQAHVLLGALQARFEQHISRHVGLAWSQVQDRLAARPEQLQLLAGMEHSGGEPDVVGHDASSGELTFVDCSVESPAGRRSLCYDGEALRARKDNRPEGSALELAGSLGITLLDEAKYRALQQLGSFDTKTSSWILTPAPIRALGGALFCDRRYDSVFTYHNGAASYYAARGFRGSLIV
ncbi:MAG: hypothetical protein RLZZ584_1990 [Pseudomonadota bacterium]|jgi:hypothetical protein